MGCVRKDKTKCRSGKHEWIDENIVVKRGVKQCRLCLRENARRLGRERRALAKTLGEAQLIERIVFQLSYWPRIEKRESGCWIWHGCKDGAGYGYVSVLSKPISAHRIAYVLDKGAIPKGTEICHSCDTPLCVNPEHLFAATHEENMRDMRAKGRWPGFPSRAKSF